MIPFVHALPRSTSEAGLDTPTDLLSERAQFEARVVAARRVYLRRVYLRNGGRWIRRVRRRRRALLRKSSLPLETQLTRGI